jgi:hypothetical protein
LFPGTVVVLVVVVVTVVVCELTTSVELETALALPPDVCAVTSARTRWSTSAERTPYVRPVAPAMFKQPVPSGSQRCHWRENEVGAGDQVPLLTDNCSPTRAVPATAGLTEFVGPFFDVMISLGSDGADAFPSAFDAVTATRSVRETSPPVAVYVFSVAPVMSPQPVPSLAQRCH